jgi:hypothetical protein
MTRSWQKADKIRISGQICQNPLYQGLCSGTSGGKWSFEGALTKAGLLRGLYVLKINRRIEPI